MKNLPDRLYEVSHDLEVLIAELDNPDEDWNEDAEAIAKEKLERLSVTYEWLLDNLAKKIKNVDQEKELLKKRLEIREAECKILRTRLKSKERFQTWLKNAAKNTMVRFGFKRLETPSGIRLTVAKRPVSCEVVKKELIPDEWFRIKREPNVSGMVDNFKETGELIQGVIFHTDKTSLRIK